MPIWSRMDIRDDQKYRLGLCQDSEGQRYFRLLSQDAQLSAFFDIVNVTDVVPNELLKKRNLIEISESVALQSGEKFYVEAHGIWLTSDEERQLFSEVGGGEIVWSTAVPPKLAPA